MKLKNKSAIKDIEQVLKLFKGRGFVAEEMRNIITVYGGEFTSVDNVSRKLRELGGLGKAKGIKVKGKTYKKWFYQEAAC